MSTSSPFLKKIDGFFFLCTYSCCSWIHIPPSYCLQLSFRSSSKIHVSYIRSHSLFSMICFGFFNTFHNPILKTIMVFIIQVTHSMALYGCIINAFWFYIIFLSYNTNLICMFESYWAMSWCFHRTPHNSSTLCCVKAIYLDFRILHLYFGLFSLTHITSIFQHRM